MDHPFVKHLIVMSLLICSILSFAYCQGSAGNTTGKLEAALRGVGFKADVPMEWPHSWPIPTGNKRGTEFKVFFYPIPGRKVPAAEFRIYTPQAEATLDITDGSVTHRAKYGGPKKEISSKRWPDELSGISIDEFEKLQTRLYEATEEVALIYAAKGEPTEAERQKMRAYGELFSKMAEPALRPYYYEMSRDFWDWLKKYGAPSISR